jgi:hypothetical protein
MLIVEIFEKCKNIKPKKSIKDPTTKGEQHIFKCFSTFINFLFCFVFETGSGYIAQVGVSLSSFISSFLPSFLFFSVVLGLKSRSPAC